MKGNEGYINIVAVMQKYFDQQLVVIGHTIQKIMKTIKCMFSNGQDLLSTYKYSWKTLIIKILMTVRKIDEASHIRLARQCRRN